MKSVLKRLCISAVAGGLLAGVSIGTSADELSDRIAAGEPIRLGFATAIPWAYPGENGEALGFVNALTLVVLEEMGITRHETSVNEWAGLIPGLQADRYDIITGGMYILKSRCQNINFSDPIGLFGDAFLVPAGNPMDIHTYQDIIRTGAKLVTGAGFNTVEAAKKEGVPEDQMMLVAGEVEILAAMKAGRGRRGRSDLLRREGARRQVRWAVRGHRPGEASEVDAELGRHRLSQERPRFSRRLQRGDGQGDRRREVDDRRQPLRLHGVPASGPRRFHRLRLRQPVASGSARRTAERRMGRRSAARGRGTCTRIRTTGGAALLVLP